MTVRPMASERNGEIARFIVPDWPITKLGPLLGQLLMLGELSMLLMSTHHTQLWPEFSWNSARFLATGAIVTLRLSVEVPIGNSATRDAKWMRNSNVGNFKARDNSTGKTDFYPFFRLVSLTKGDISIGELEKDLPLPDALPP